MGPGAQDAEILAFGRKDLLDGCRTKFDEDLSEIEIKAGSEAVRFVSSSFTMWQREGDEREGRFVMNLPRRSKFGTRKPLKMKRPEDFTTERKKWDLHLSFELTAGYRHVHLHPRVYDNICFPVRG